MHSGIRLPVIVLVAASLLAVAGCAGVPPARVLPVVTLGGASSRATLETYGGAPIEDGNRVEILLNGDQIFPAELAGIRAARSSVTYAQYFYGRGRIAEQIAEALADRARAGVAVHVLLDGFGALGVPRAYIDLMERAGCQVAMFRPLTDLDVRRDDDRNHRRILVVDGRLGFTGGSGVGDKWLGDGRLEGHWRDTNVAVEGPVVQHLQAAFAENWLEATGVGLGGERYFPPLAPEGSVAAQVVASSPLKHDLAIHTTFLMAIAAAQRSIHITNPYFVPDEGIAQALLSAARRGVRVTVLAPGQIDWNIVRHASRREYGRFLRGGIDVYEYRAGLLHAKTMVIDGMWTTIGSANLDNRSMAVNSELNLVIYDREIAARMERIFAEDLRHARRVEYEQWRRRPIWHRLLELLAVPLRPEL